MQQMTIAEFHEALKAQGVTSVEDLAFVCPLCRTIQSARDLIEAGAGETFDDVERFVGFSCVGRWTGAGSPRKDPDGKPCDWTLGGFFRLHELEVTDESGAPRPRFMPAEALQAQAHAARKLIERTHQAGKTGGET